MTAELKDLRIYLSGGASNEDPNASLGGEISSTPLLSQTGSFSTSLAGVTFVDGVDNAPGAGTLRYVASTKTFYWTPPSGSEGPGVSVADDGMIVVQGGGSFAGYIWLEIDFSALPVSNASRTVTIANADDHLFDSVTKPEAYAGDVSYRCVYLKNEHATDAMVDLSVWIRQDASGPDTIAVAVDDAGIDGEAATVANEYAAPAGAVFSQPLTEGSALEIGTLEAGEVVALWIKRDVPVATVGTTPDDMAALRFRFLA